MITISCIIALGIISYFLQIPPFIGALVSLITLPLFVVPLEPSIGFYSSLVIAEAFILLILKWNFRQKRITAEPILNSGLLELFTIAPLYLMFQKLISKWPEFYNLGEHLRDFSIISAVARSPMSPKDPWCNSLDLYYYTYWYRFGYVIKQIFNLTTAERYQFLVAFCLSLLFAVLLRASRILLQLNWQESFFIAFATVFGSNISGIVSASEDAFWWGPSRAYKAGITEFPIWSFLLGDPHPHYLSLVFLPLFLLLIKESGFLFELTFRSLIQITAFLFGAFCLVYDANSWDVVGFSLITPFLVGAFFIQNKAALKNKTKLTSSSIAIVIFCLTIGLLAIFRAPKIGLNPVELKFTASYSPQVYISEFLSHWGIQFLALTLALLPRLWRQFSSKKFNLITPTIFLFCLAFSTYIDSVFLFLASTIFLVSLSTWKGIVVPNYSDKEAKTEIDLALVLGALFVLLFTELFYFDDLYTGENERLNTIFKFTYFAWVPFSVGALSLFIKELRKLPVQFRTPWVVYPSMLAAVALLISFFAQVSLGNGGRKVVLARYDTPRSEGLSTLDAEVPGSADVIRALRKLPTGLNIIEWAEPAYTSAGSLCSLSEHDCYIGWRNHLSIQYKSGLEEYDRREEIVHQIYSSSSCEQKKSLIQSEKIGAIVVGPREFAANPDLISSDFDCFSAVRKFQKVTLYLP